MTYCTSSLPKKEPSTGGMLERLGTWTQHSTITITNLYNNIKTEKRHPAPSFETSAFTTTSSTILIEQRVVSSLPGSYQGHNSITIQRFASVASQEGLLSLCHPEEPPLTQSSLNN